MGDRTYALIVIGGRLDPSKVQVLADAIASEGLQDYASDTDLSGAYARQVLESRAERGEAADFSAMEVDNGEFADLEALCCELNLDFRRTNDAGDEYGASVTRFTPGANPDGSDRRYLDNIPVYDGEPVLMLGALRTIKTLEALNEQREVMEWLISEPPPLVIAGPLTALVEQAEQKHAGSN